MLSGDSTSGNAVASQENGEHAGTEVIDKDTEHNPFEEFEDWSWFDTIEFDGDFWSQLAVHPSLLPMGPPI